MSAEPKRWKTEIWLGEALNEPVTVYGESLEKLRLTAKVWLQEHQPTTFANGPANNLLPDCLTTYIYSDGTRQVPVFSLDTANKTETLAAGWYSIEGSSLYPHPRSFANFEQVILHFSDQTLIPVVGPDYSEPTFESKGGYLTRIVTHPAVLGLIVGGVSAVCYMGIPISGGKEKNFMLTQGSFTPIVIFMVLMIIFFVMIGLVTAKGLAIIQTRKQK